VSDSRPPGNTVGWIFTAVGLLTMTAGLAEVYARHADTHPGSLPAGRHLNPGLDLASDDSCCAGVPAAVVPDRPVAVASLAAGDLVGGWPGHGIRRLGALSPSLQLPIGRTVANPSGWPAWIWTLLPSVPS
jgi:hypothetical protein